MKTKPYYDETLTPTFEREIEAELERSKIAQAMSVIRIVPADEDLEGSYRQPRSLTVRWTAHKSVEYSKSKIIAWLWMCGWLVALGFLVWEVAK